MITPCTRLMVALALSSAACWSVAQTADSTILTEMPPDRDLRQGRSVYVDDGTCPVGKVKQVTGGNREKGIARRVECVKRPAAP